MAIIIEEIIPRAIHSEREAASHANPLDAMRETCVGCASAGLVRDAFWHEMREIRDPEATQQFRTEDCREKNAFFIVISTDIQL